MPKALTVPGHPPLVVQPLPTGWVQAAPGATHWPEELMTPEVGGLQAVPVAAGGVRFVQEVVLLGQVPVPEGETWKVEPVAKRCPPGVKMFVASRVLKDFMALVQAARAEPGTRGVGGTL